jgi:hypothetical protein
MSRLYIEGGYLEKPSINKVKSAIEKLNSHAVAYPISRAGSLPAMDTNNPRIMTNVGGIPDPNPNPRNIQESNGHLIYAAFRGDLSSLFVAGHEGHARNVVEILLAHGANVRQRDKENAADALLFMLQR